MSKSTFNLDYIKASAKLGQDLSSSYSESLTRDSIQQNQNPVPISESELSDKDKTERDLISHGKLNSSRTWLDETKSILIGNIWSMGVMQIAATGMALADPADAIADPFSLSLNGIRKLLWNLSPSNPIGLGASLGNKDIADLNALMLEQMDKDETGKAITWTASDNDVIPGLNLPVGVARAWWDSKRDGKPSNAVAEFFYNDYKLMEDRRAALGQYEGPGAYWVNNATNLVGSVGASVLTGYLTGGALGALGNVRSLPAVAGLNKLNNLNRFKSYQKLSQGLVAFSQTGGESLMEGMQSRDITLDKAYQEVGGKSYTKGLEDYITNRFVEMKTADPNLNLDKVELQQHMRAFKEEYRQQWNSQNPELGKKITDMGDLAFETAVGFNSINFLMNLSIAGRYLKPSRNKIMTNPVLVMDKSTIKEMANEYGEEAINAVSQIMAEKKVFEGHANATDFVKAFGDASVHEAGAWGAVGGGGQSVMTNAINMKDLKARYRAQQAVIKRFHEIENMVDPQLIDKHVFLASTLTQTGVEMERIDKLYERGETEAAKAAMSRLFQTQALNAFETGTTKALVHMYEKLSENPNLSEDQRKAANTALGHITKLEGIYNDASTYQNSEDVYVNKAQQYFIQQGLKELGVVENEKFEEAKSVIEQGLSAGKFKDLLSPETVAIMEQFSSAQLVEGNFYSSGEQDKQHVTSIAEFMEKLVPVQEYKKLRSEFTKAHDALSNLKDEYSYLTSLKTQEQTRTINNFYKTMAEVEMIGTKEMSKRGKKFSPYSSKAYEKFYMDRLSKLHASKSISSADFRKLKDNYLTDKALYEIQTLSSRAEATKINNKPVVNPASGATTVTVTNPDLVPEVNPVHIANTANTVAAFENIAAKDFTAEESNVFSEEELNKEGSSGPTDFMVETGFSLAPRRKTDQVKEEEWKFLENNMASYFEGLKDKLGVEPTFRDVISDMIENSSRDRTEGIYDFLAEAWKRNSAKNPNKFKPAEFEKIHSELFTSLNTLRDNFFQAENFGTATEDVSQDQQETAVAEQTAKYDFGNESVLNTPASTAGYSSHNYKQVLTPVYKEENGQKIVDYIAVSWVYEKTEEEDFMNEPTPFSSKFINAKPIVHPDQFREGTVLTATIHPDAKNIGYYPRWKTKEWYDGLQMQPVEGQKFITYGDALQGITAQFYVPVDNQNAEAKQEIISVDIKIEEGSDEYWDTVPMVFTKKDGDLSEGSAFIHTPDWYHNSRFVEEEKKAVAIAETRAIRAEVRKNGSVSLTIINKNIGTFAKCKVYNHNDDSGVFSKVTLRESNPQSFIVVAAAESRGGILVRGEDGRMVSFDNDKRFVANAQALKEMAQRDKNTTFQLMRAGVVDGRESYIGFALFQNDIKNASNNEEYYKSIARNIKAAIDIYMSQNDPAATEHHRTAQEFYDTTGYSLADIAGLHKYIGSMIMSIEAGNKEDSTEEVLRKVVEKAERMQTLPVGSPYITFVRGQINIGIKGKTFPNGKGGSYSLQTINRASKMNARVLYNLQQTVLNTDVIGQLARSNKDVLIDAFTGDQKFVFFNENGTIDQTKTTTYTDFLMDSLYSDLKAVNIGTEANPFYTVFVQPTIAFARTESVNMTLKDQAKFEDTGIVSETIKNNIEEKQKEGTPLTAAETVVAAHEPVVVPEAPIQEATLSDEDAEFLLAMSQSTNNMLSPEEREMIQSLEDLRKKREEGSFAAMALEEDAIQRMREISERIPGLLPHEQDELVNVLSQYIFTKLGQSEDSKLTDTEISDLCYNYMRNHIVPIIEAKQKELARAKAISQAHPELVGLPAQIIQTQKLIDKCNLILDNRDLIVKEVYQSVANENSVSERDTEGEKIEKEDEDLDIESSYSKSELEDNVREQASSQIRKFLRGIPQRNSDGSLKQGFLGFPVPVNINDLFNTLTGLLADRPANLQAMIKVMKEHGTAHPEIYVVAKENATEQEKENIAKINTDTLVGRLQSADIQLQNQFVSLMAKHAVKMKFAMYSYNRRTKKYSLRVWDTNSASVNRKIQSDWNSNILEKMTDPDPETGDYVMNVHRAAYLLDKFDSWKAVSYDIMDTAEVGAGNVSIGLREIDPTVQNRIAKGEAVEVDLRNNRANAPLTLMMNKRRAATPSHVGVKAAMGKMIINITPTAIDGVYTIRTPRKSSYTHADLINWLATFGVTISPEVITEFEKEGIYAGGKSNKRIFLADMFQESAKSEGIFGLIAHKLRGVVEAHNRKDENGNPDPKKVVFGHDGDINFNDEVITKVAKTEAKYTSHVVASSWRDNGKTIYGFSPTKFTTDRVNALKNFEQIGDKQICRIIEDLKKVGFSKEAILIQLLEANPEFLAKFQVSHIGLTAIKESGKTVYKDNGITKLSDADHELSKRTGFEDMKQGNLSDYLFEWNGTKYQLPMRMATMFGLTMSDKDAMFEFQTAVFSLAKRQNFEINLETQKITGLNAVMKEILYRQTVLPELRRAVEFAKYGTNIHGHEGRMLFFFPALNNISVTVNGVEETLVDVLRAGQRSVEEIEAQYKEEIIKKLNESVNTLVQEKLAIWKEEGFIKDIPAVYKDVPTGEFTETDQETNIPIMKQELVSAAKTELKFFDVDYLYSMGEKNATLQAQLAAYDYTVNYLIHNANMFMVFAGDPAQYYKKDKETSALDYVKIARDTFVNIGKRMALLNAPGIKIADSDSNQYIELVLKDIENEAYGYEQIKNILGEEAASAYKKTTGTDGQEYTTWREHLYILEKMGRTPESIINITPEEIAAARKLFSSGKSKADMTERDKAILKKVLQPMKPVYTGSEYDSVNKVMRTVYIKTSSFPLIPQLTEGLELDKLRVMMQKIESTHGKTVRATFHSGAKTGSYKEAFSVVDEKTMEFVHTDANNNKISLDQLDPHDIVSKYGMVLSRNNFRIQQDVPFKTAKRKEDVVSMGTQMVKIMLGSGAMEIQDFEYFGNFDGDGNFIADPSKKTGLDILKIYQKLFDKLIVYKKQQLYKQLGLNTLGQVKNGNTAEVAKRIQRILKEEAISRGYPKQDIDSLEIDGAGNFIIPIWLLSNGEKLESLLNAIVEKRVAKIKFPGNSYVVGSEFGFKLKVKKENEISGAVKNQIIWINESAQQGLAHNQVLVASKFRDKEGNLIDLVSQGYAVQKTVDGRTFWTLDKSKFDPDVLSMLNFRTPTSAHNSLSVDEIVGFLPHESADLMVVSRNKTTQKGIDFDIDKESAYQLWHTIDDSGKIVSLDKLYSLSTIDGLIKNRLDAIKKIKKRGLDGAEQLALEEWSYDNEMLEDLTDEEEAALQEEFVAGRVSELTSMKLQELLAKASELAKIKEKLHHNEIIKLQSSVLTHRDMQKNMIKVLSMDNAEENASMIEGLKEAPEGQEFNPLSDEYQKGKVFLGASGKIAVGAYSLDVVGHSLFQQAKAAGRQLQLNIKKVDPETGKEFYVPYQIRFGRGDTFVSNGFLGENETLGTNPARRIVSDVLSERQNIATDNEKVQIMGRVNLNDITIDADKVLTMLQFDAGEDGSSISMLFMSQPIIVDYVNELRKVSSNIAGFAKNKKEAVVQALIEKYGGQGIYNHDSENDISRASDEMTNANMKEQISNGGTNAFLQQAILYRFLDLSAMGLNLRKVQTTINIDSKGLGISLFESLEKIQKVEDLLEMQSITNADALVGEYVSVTGATQLSRAEMINLGYIPLRNYYIKPTTVAGSFTVHTLATTYNLWSRYFPYDADTINHIYKELEEIIGATNEANESDSNRLRFEDKQNILREIKKYLFSSNNLGLFDGDAQAERYRLYMDEFELSADKKIIYHTKTSLPYYLKAVLANKNTPDVIRKNLFLRSLTFDIQKNGTPSRVTFNNASDEGFDPDAIYRSVTDLFTATVNGKPVELLKLNNKTYTSIDLAQDLIAYAYLEGGIQEVIQFVKFVPVSYLKEIPFSRELRRIHNLLTAVNPVSGAREETLTLTTKNLFGIDSGKMSNEPEAKYKYSRVALQYVQHHPESLVKITEEEIRNGDITFIGAHRVRISSEVIKGLGTLQEFATKGTNPPAFVSIYDSEIPKGQKKFQLFRYDPASKTYKKIPVYGVFGMSEYNLNSTDKYYKSLVNKNTVVQADIEEEGSSGQKSREIPFTTNAFKEALFNTTVITESHLDEVIAILEADSTVNVLYPALLRELKSAISQENLQLDVASVIRHPNTGKSLSVYGVYMNGKITLQKDLVQGETNDKVARIYIHELLHGLANSVVDKYYIERGMDGEVVSGAPQYMIRLANLYKAARSSMGDEAFFQNITTKVKTGDKLTREEYEAYGGTELKEFITEIMSNPVFQKKMASIPYKGTNKTLYQKFVDFLKHALQHLKIDVPTDSITHQAMISVMELVQDKTGGILYNRKVEHAESFRKAVLDLQDGDVITMEYFSGTSAERDFKVRTVEITEVGEDSFRGHDNMSGEVRKFLFSNINAIMRIEKISTDTVDVWYGADKNPLSNLAFRKFTFGGRQYVSVEHAYQSLKSGEFDQDIYNQYLTHGAGVKLRSRKPALTTDNYNLGLMKDLIYESVKQNPDVATALLETGSATITHKRDSGVWKTEFPKILMQLRYDIKNTNFMQPANTFVPPALPVSSEIGAVEIPSMRLKFPDSYERKAAEITENFNAVQGGNLNQYWDPTSILHALEQDMEQEGFSITGYAKELRNKLMEEYGYDSIDSSLTDWTNYVSAMYKLIKSKQEQAYHPLTAALDMLSKQFLSEDVIPIFKGLINNPEMSLQDMDALVNAVYFYSDEELLEMQRVVNRAIEEFNTIAAANQLSLDFDQVEDTGYTVKVDHYTLTVKKDGVYYANGEKVTDKTTLNKVHMATQFDANRLIEYNGFNFYVMPDNTIVSHSYPDGSPVRDYGKEAYRGSQGDQNNILAKYLRTLEIANSQIEKEIAEANKLEAELRAKLDKDKGTQSLSPAAPTFTKEDVLKLYNNEFEDFEVLSMTPKKQELSQGGASQGWYLVNTSQGQDVYERWQDKNPTMEAYQRGEILKENMRDALANIPYTYTKNKKAIAENEFEANRVSGKEVLIQYGNSKSTFILTDDGYLVEGRNKVKATSVQSSSPSAPDTDLFSMENMEEQISDTFVDESGQKIC